MAIYKFCLEEERTNKLNVYIDANSKEEAEDKLKYGDYSRYTAEQFLNETSGAEYNIDKDPNINIEKHINFAQELGEHELPKGITPLK